MTLLLDKKVMIDIETTGIKPGCCILSVGACTLDLVHSFYTTISLEDSLTAGFCNDPSTLEWWNQQKPELQEEAFNGKTKLQDALYQLSDWIYSLDGVEEFWCKGTNFDFPVLDQAYKHYKLKTPWVYNQVRDYRTLRKVVEGVPCPVNENLHNALADARNQADHCARILERIYTWQL